MNSNTNAMEGGEDTDCSQQTQSTKTPYVVLYSLRF